MKKITLLLILFTYFSFCQDFTDNVQEIISPNAVSSGDFGWSVATGQGFIAVGAPGEFNIPNASGNITTGVVYIYKRDGLSNWTLAQRLAPPDGASSDRFGISVAIHDNYLVVGAHQHDLNSTQDAGAAYVFELDPNNNYTIVNGRKLVASDGGQLDIFGISVSVFGDDVVVGAPRQDLGNPNQSSDFGAVYVFRRQSNGDWLEVQKISPQDVLAGDNFGRGLALDNNRMLVGAENANGSDGKAYMYVKNAVGQYVLEDTILPNSVNGTDNSFGLGLDIYGNNSIIGAFRYNNNRGNIFIYNKNSSNAWNYVANSESIITSTPSNVFVGWDIALYGNYCVVGAQGSIQSGTVTGKAIIVSKIGNTWSSVQELLPPTTNDFTNSQFGRSVSIEGQVIAVGVPKRSQITLGQTNVGTVFIYETNSTLSNEKLETSIAKIYPNPIENGFVLDYNLSDIQKVELYNTNGQLVKTFKALSYYDISQFESGIYFLRIQTKDYSIKMKKIIKS